MSLENLKIQSYILYEPTFLGGLSANMYQVTLERRPQREGDDKWAIAKPGAVLSKSEKDFVYESQPSSRTAKILKDTRFVSAEEAYKFWVDKIQDKYDLHLKEMAERAKYVTHS